MGTGVVATTMEWINFFSMGRVEELMAAQAKNVRITGLTLADDDGSGFRDITGGRVQVTDVAAGANIKPGEAARRALKAAANVLFILASNIHTANNFDAANPGGVGRGPAPPPAIPLNGPASPAAILAAILGARAAITVSAAAAPDLRAGVANPNMLSKESALEAVAQMLRAEEALRMTDLYRNAAGLHAAKAAAVGAAPAAKVQGDLAALGGNAALAGQEAAALAAINPAITALHTALTNVAGTLDASAVAVAGEAAAIMDAAMKDGNPADLAHPLRGVTRRDAPAMIGGYRGGAYEEEAPPPPPPPSARHRKTASGRRNRKRASRKSRS